MLVFLFFIFKQLHKQNCSWMGVWDDEAQPNRYTYTIKEERERWENYKRWFQQAKQNQTQKVTDPATRTFKHAAFSQNLLYQHLASILLIAIQS